MSSLRLVNARIADPERGVCNIICDWHKDRALTTAIVFDMGRGQSKVEEQRSHATLGAALSRCARLAKRAKV